LHDEKPVSNIGASVRRRLLILREKTSEDFLALLIQFAIERLRGSDPHYTRETLAHHHGGGSAGRLNTWAAS